MDSNDDHLATCITEDEEQDDIDMILFLAAAHEVSHKRRQSRYVWDQIKRERHVEELLEGDDKFTQCTK